MNKRTRIDGRPSVAAAVLGLGILAGPASAVIVQDTGGSLPTDIPTSAIGTWGNNAAAVAVGDQWVLTTRHQDNGQVDRQVTLDGQTYNALAENQIVFDDGLDLRLVKLTETGTGDAANLTDTIDLFTGNSTFQTAVITGFGPTIGSEVSGGFDISGSENNSNGLSIGQNRLQNPTMLAGDFSDMLVLRADFDDASGFAAEDFEATVGVGDSGGAWLLEVDGEWQLAGLTHAVQTGTDGQPDAFFGQNFYAVDLSVLADTIQQAIDQDYIAGDYNGDGFVSQADLDLVLLNWGQEISPIGWVALEQRDGAISQSELDGVLLNWGSTQAPDLTAATVTGGALTTVPEPTSVLLVLAGSAALLGVRRRGHAV